MEKKRRAARWLRLLAASCAAALLIPLVGAAAGSVDDLKNKYEELERQRSEIQRQLDSAKNQKDEQVALKQQLDGQIELTRQQINTLDQRLSALSDEIAGKETEVQEKQVQIDANIGLFQERLRAMQLSGNSTKLGLLFGSDSFSDFLSKAENMQRISDHDKKLVDGLVADRLVIEDAKAQIVADQQEVEKAKEEMQSKKVELDKQLATAKQQLQSIEELEQQYNQNKDKVDKDMKNVQSDIDEIYRQNASNGDYVGGEFTWPVPGYSGITSYYGWRFNNTDFHTGIDISGSAVYGKNIVAANSGKVISTTTSYTPGVGYGIYLIIDHGGGMSTLYGHTSQLYVKTGDYVQKGQVIAAVGSTGWSTGPHLHFEIRQNGQHTNPLNHFQKK